MRPIFAKGKPNFVIKGVLKISRITFLRNISQAILKIRKVCQKVFVKDLHRFDLSMQKKIAQISRDFFKKGFKSSLFAQKINFSISDFFILNSGYYDWLRS